jgi:hypothetical protein
VTVYLSIFSSYEQRKPVELESRIILVVSAPTAPVEKSIKNGNTVQ